MSIRRNTKGDRFRQRKSPNSLPFATGAGVMTQQEKLPRVPDQKDHVVLHAIALSILCVISYWLITHLLAYVFPVSRDDDLLGGMWAVVATIFVYRYSYEQSAGAALSRMAATSLSFVLCFVYLLVFPPEVWGMAAVIGIGAVLMAALDSPGELITTGVMPAGVLAVAGLSPRAG